MATRRIDLSTLDSEGLDRTRSVLAGIDGGPLVGAVLQAAAEEAVRRGLVLDLVTVVGSATVGSEAEAWSLPGPGRLLADPRTGQPSASPWLLAHRGLAAAADEALGTCPDLEIRTWCVAQEDVKDPSAAALRLPAAELLVVGARGRNRTPAFGLRSASRLLAKRFAAPMLVVPSVGPASPRGPVLVGLRDRRDVEVLRSAVEESALRDAPLVVVLVLPRPRLQVDPGPRAVLDRVPVPPRTRVIAVTPTDAAPALVRVATTEDAQLLVIGTHGPTSLAGLAQKSTSRAVIRLSSRPVLLVPTAVKDPLPRGGAVVPAEEVGATARARGR